MAPSAERQQVQDTVFAPAGVKRAALAKRSLRPERSPNPTPERKTAPEQRQTAHLTIVQYAAGLAMVAGVVGAVFLGGHVQLAREAQRSVTVNDMLKQQLERSRLLGNAQAKDVTPTSISQKAGLVGMVHPDERDTINMP